MKNFLKIVTMIFYFFFFLMARDILLTARDLLERN